MSDIFISYKREEQPTARQLADALKKEGWNVWWDPKLRTGEHFDDVIEKALNEAKCVIVMWSELSVQSQYVRDEATYALEKGKLLPVTIEKVNLPFRFRGVQTLNLLGWNGSEDSMEFRRLVEDISSKLGPAAIDSRKPESEQNSLVSKLTSLAGAAEPKRSIGDTIIDQVRRYLYEQLLVPPSSQGRPSLTTVLMELRALFSRIAFAQPIKQSADKDWANRLCVLCQTLDLLEEYRTAVHGQTTAEERPLLISYDAIIADLQEYVMAMTAFFAPRLLFADARNECKDDVNKFRTRVRPTALPEEAIHDAKLEEAEEQRIKIVRELRKWPGSTGKRTQK
jgi:hypothetical protein